MHLVPLIPYHFHHNVSFTLPRSFCSKAYIDFTGCTAAATARKEPVRCVFVCDVQSCQLSCGNGRGWDGYHGETRCKNGVFQSVFQSAFYSDK